MKPKFDPQEPFATRATRAAYYEQGAGWARDVGGAVRRSTRTAWLAAAAAGLVALANGGALLALQPVRKRLVEVISVDRQGSEPLRVRALAAGSLQSDPTFAQAELALYVTAREKFDPATIRRDFVTVERLSNEAMKREYERSMFTVGAVTPLQTYGPKARLEVVVRSVSLLASGTALVRYDLVRTDIAGAPPETFQADVAYTFTRAPMRNLDRYENPLGFLVTDYRKAPG